MDQLEFSPANDEDDLVLGLEQQAALLRARQFDHLDIGNIVDELEGAAHAGRRELAGYLRHIVSYLLSLQSRPPHKPCHWRAKLAEARFGMELLIDDSPSLAADIAGMASRYYDASRRRAARENCSMTSSIRRARPMSAAELTAIKELGRGPTRGVTG